MTQAWPTTNRPRDSAGPGGASSVPPPAGGGAARGTPCAPGPRARPADKPLHPVGAVSRGTLHRYGLTPSVGVKWLDEPGQDKVLVRFSRALGLPGPLPDVLGLAVRIPQPAGE